MNEFKDLPVERSDDPRRGEMQHIRAAVTGLAVLKRADRTPCGMCATGRGSHVVDTRRSARIVCASCAKAWRDMTPLQRMQARTTTTRRG